MGRPRSNLILPKYASSFQDRHGRQRIRFRRTGWRTVYTRDAPGTVEFTQAYKQWENSLAVQVGSERFARGSFNDLITRFYKSDIWSGLRASTQEQYRGQLERFRAEYGERSAITVSTRNLQTILNAMSDTPAAANNLRKRLKQLMGFAVFEGLRIDNPATSTRSLKVEGDGFPDWSEEEIQQFEAYHPMGTMARLAFDLALYTAQRKSDVNVMGAKELKNGTIRVKQLKTNKRLMIRKRVLEAAGYAA